MSVKESQFHQLKKGCILNNKYVIDGVLGEGGFGITYKAIDTILDITVAIKEYYPSGFATREVESGNTVSSFTGEKLEVYETGKSKFLREARTLARLSGQNGIVAVKDFFQENNTAYIVMEYLDGVTLKEYLKQSGGRISAGDTIKLMEPVVKSLGEVHKQGMIHRDISPDNIMVVQGDRLKLLDFGAARDVNVNGEKSLSVMLKHGYAPEEQYRTRGHQGPWTDVYALCATVYRCIVGKIPIESLERYHEDSLKMPSELGIEIDKHQEEILLKGLAVFQKDRIQSSEELYELWYGEELKDGHVESAVNEYKEVSVKEHVREPINEYTESASNKNKNLLADDVVVFNEKQQDAKTVEFGKKKKIRPFVVCCVVIVVLLCMLVVSKTSHTCDYSVVEEYVASTCVTEGRYTYSCSICGKNTSGSLPIDPNGHEFEVYKKQIVYVDGKKCTRYDYECSLCSFFYVEEVY